MDLDMVSNQVEMRLENVPRIASVALFCAGMVLLGLRREERTWTLPGGHIEPGETPMQGAWRELIEETGIVPSKIEPLGDVATQGRSGAIVHIFAFRAFVGVEALTEATNKDDPDHEIKEWRWVSTHGGLDPQYRERLHDKQNVVLRKLGVI